MTERDEHCLECVFHGWIEGRVACLYLSKTGQRRGCDPGLACKRFQPIRRRRSQDSGGTLKYGNKEMVPLSISALVDLEDRASFREIARVVGCHRDTIRNSLIRGTVSLELRDRILEVYGVDLQEHK
jgi:hypothetical protein